MAVPATALYLDSVFVLINRGDPVPGKLDAMLSNTILVWLDGERFAREAVDEFDRLERLCLSVKLDSQSHKNSRG